MTFEQFQEKLAKLLSESIGLDVKQIIEELEIQVEILREEVKDDE